MRKVYEVDELCTFIKNKKNKIWIVYALERSSGHIVSFAIGRRTNKTLKKVTDILHLSRAKRIFTDRLKQYKTIIDQSIHKITRYDTNRIERYNLSLRTHIKRLNRRSICYTRSISILKAILKIYFYKWNII